MNLENQTSGHPGAGREPLTGGQPTQIGLE